VAAYVKFNQFSEDLCSGKHDLTAGGHVCKAYLSNAAPSASLDLIKTDLAEITAQNGYPAGGSDLQNALSEAGGTTTVTAVDIVWTASGGSFGPFQYVVTYNDTQTSPVDPLINYWDYGSSITVLDGETFTLDLGASWLTLA
jgi:hypothetical protein